MKDRRRPTQQSTISHSFGGRSWTDEPPPGPPREGEPQTRGERRAAFLTWLESSNHFEEYADDGRTRLHFWEKHLDILIGLAVIVVFVGGYAAFLFFLAVTR